jgi:hypothetical protein
MDTPGVGILIDPDRIDKIDPYYVEIRGTRYYGSSSEDAVRQARKAVQAKMGITTDMPRGDKQKPSTNIIPVPKPTPRVSSEMLADQKLLGVSARATTAEIKAAHKKAVLAGHSNKGGTQDIGALTAARDRLLAAAAKAPKTANTAKTAKAAKPKTPTAAKGAKTPAAAKPKTPTVAKPKGAKPKGAKSPPAAKAPAAPAPAKGGGKRRKSLTKTRVFRKHRSTTRKHLK